MAYKICSRCIMDTSAENISFDNDNRCNFCTVFINTYKDINKKKNIKSSILLKELISICKRKSSNKKYDCIIGLSGGLDSSWTLVQALKLGLRPLAVHMDNGWNSELAQNNIFNLVDKLEVDLYTHVIDWNEYRNLMQSFFDSDVLDVELLYDNAMLAVNYNQAKLNNINYILGGTNVVTEGIKMPYSWSWLKYDKKNIQNIAKLNNVKLRTFPSIGTLERIFYEKILGIRWISFLDFISYEKENALEELIKNYNYKPYPYKHYESIFTRFYQGYILPKKFGIDKRRIHLSNLIVTNSITRNDAIKIMKKPPYSSMEDLEEDKEYFLKKMGWNNIDLEEYLKRPGIPHDKYPSEIHLHNKIRRLRSKKYFQIMNKILKNKFQ